MPTTGPAYLSNCSEQGFTAALQPAKLATNAPDVRKVAVSTALKMTNLHYIRELARLNALDAQGGKPVVVERLITLFTDVTKMASMQNVTEVIAAVAAEQLSGKSATTIESAPIAPKALPGGLKPQGNVLIDEDDDIADVPEESLESLKRRALLGTIKLNKSKLKAVDEKALVKGGIMASALPERLLGQKRGTQALMVYLAGVQSFDIHNYLPSVIRKAEELAPNHQGKFMNADIYKACTYVPGTAISREDFLAAVMLRTSQSEPEDPATTGLTAICTLLMRAGKSRMTGPMLCEALNGLNVFANSINPAQEACRSNIYNELVTMAMVDAVVGKAIASPSTHVSPVQEHQPIPKRMKPYKPPATSPDMPGPKPRVANPSADAKYNLMSTACGDIYCRSFNKSGVKTTEKYKGKFCLRANCTLKHICAKCKSPAHYFMTCPAMQDALSKL